MPTTTPIWIVLCTMLVCSWVHGAHSAQTVGVFNTVEISLGTAPDHECSSLNPFDYSQLDPTAVVATVLLPNGNSEHIDAFWFQNFTYNSTTVWPVGSPQWLLRYNPRHVGPFSICLPATALPSSCGSSTLRQNTPSRTSDAPRQHSKQSSESGRIAFGYPSLVLDKSGMRQGCLNFTALAVEDMRGFVGIGPNNQHFQFRGDLSTFYGVGENMCWGGTGSYTTWFSKFSQIGHGNYFRIWMNTIESSFGRYDPQNTWMVDFVLNYASAIDAYVQMCIESFTSLCTDPRYFCAFDNFSYNSKNGGPISTPQEFFTDATAIAAFKNRLRYLIARFGSSKHVLGWELFNEVDGTTGYDQNTQATWITGVLDSIHASDVYDHLVTTSFANSWLNESEVWHAGLNYTQIHTYSSHNMSSMADNNHYFSNKFVDGYPEKPTFIGEFSESGSGPPDAHDPTGVSLHNGMWASFVSRSAVAAATWWWDNWVDPYNLYYQFAGLSAFTKLEQWANFHWRQCDDIHISQPATMTKTSMISYGMCGDPLTGDQDVAQPPSRIVVWSQNGNYTWCQVVEGAIVVPIEGANMTVQALAAGTAAVLLQSSQSNPAYDVQCYETRNGTAIGSKFSATLAPDGTLQWQLPSFLPDVACIARLSDRKDDVHRTR